MSNREKLTLLTDLLMRHKDKIQDVLVESDVQDYGECIQLFLSSTDPIIQEGALATCQLIIKNSNIC
ncbi:hypothetical protein [Planococcus sp. NCCP-2050]|uniref:hypothetical protein n=1 Tax=Planococcus sp. NCCP-2050 TaxID=2944679 RepID=UPI00203BA6CB|nr:hypothetical protein [Planococcus sp. NCCP-2050]GKW47007.1 hypothetical protein NCCP2050_26990 [Planococcus sp. NCCP-2050]